MALIQKLLVVLGASSAAFSQELDKSTAKSRQWAAQQKGIFDKVKAGLGEDSNLGKMTKVLQGAGAVAGFAAVGAGLNKVTAKIIELRKEAAEAGYGWKEYTSAIVESLPVIGQFWQAGQNIRELLTGERAALEASIAANAALAKSTEYLISSLKARKKAHEELNAVLADRSADRSVRLMTEGPDKNIARTALERQRSRIAEAKQSAATIEKIKADTDARMKELIGQRTKLTDLQSDFSNQSWGGRLGRWAIGSEKQDMSGDISAVYREIEKVRKEGQRLVADERMRAFRMQIENVKDLAADLYAGARNNFTKLGSDSWKAISEGMTKQAEERSEIEKRAQKLVGRLRESVMGAIREKTALISNAGKTVWDTVTSVMAGRPIPPKVAAFFDQMKSPLGDRPPLLERRFNFQLVSSIGSIPMQQLSETKRQTKLLERIDDNTGTTNDIIVNF